MFFISDIMVKVSVVIPVYNASKYLGECLDSIVNQTLEDIEIICVDDESEDNSVEILEKYSNNDNRISIYKKNHGGGGSARNYALNLVEGKYIYFMDADDKLKLDALETLYNTAEDKNVDFIIFQAYNYEDSEKRLYKSESYSMDLLSKEVKDKIFNCDDLSSDLTFDINVTPWSKFYNKDFVLNSGAKFPENLLFHDNIFFWETFFSAKRIYFLNGYFYCRRWHSDSSSRAMDERYIDSLTIADLIINIFKKHDKINEKYIYNLFNKVVDINYYRFKVIQNEYKQIYFNKMKEVYSNWVDEFSFEEIWNSLNNRNSFIFNNVFVVDDFNLFKSCVDLYDGVYLLHELVDENKKLKSNIEDLKAQNNNLNLKIENSKKENDELKNIINKVNSSKSWKITSPLRKLFNIFRNH